MAPLLDLCGRYSPSLWCKRKHGSWSDTMGQTNYGDGVEVAEVASPESGVSPSSGNIRRESR